MFRNFQRHLSGSCMYPNCPRYIFSLILLYMGLALKQRNANIIVFQVLSFRNSKLPISQFLRRDSTSFSQYVCNQFRLHVCLSFHLSVCAYVKHQYFIMLRTTDVWSTPTRTCSLSGYFLCSVLIEVGEHTLLKTFQVLTISLKSLNRGVRSFFKVGGQGQKSFYWL